LPGKRSVLLNNPHTAQEATMSQLTGTALAGALGSIPFLIAHVQNLLDARKATR
jgi:hypothetical protein